MGPRTSEQRGKGERHSATRPKRKLTNVGPECDAVVYAEQRLLQQALAAALTQLPFLDEVTTADDARDMVARFKQARIHLGLIVTTHADEHASIELLRRTLGVCPKATLVLVAAEPDEAYLRTAFDAGASLVLPLDAGVDELARWMEQLVLRRTRIPLRMWSELRTRLERPKRLPSETVSRGLTPRQRQLLTLLCRGLSNAEIADHVGISVKTVRNQMTHLNAKLGTASRTKAMLVALAKRLVETSEAQPSSTDARA